MPLVRCRNYDDQGVPLGGGCPQQHTCSFVHPTHPRWNEARKYNRGPGRGRGRGRGDSWGRTATLPTESADPIWDPSSWGNTSLSAPVPSLASSQQYVLSSDGLGVDNTATPGPSNSSHHAAVEKSATTNDAVGWASWGDSSYPNASADGGWGNSTDNGWGSEITTKDNQRGNSGNRWGSKATSVINTDNGRGSKTSNAINTDNGWGSKTTSAINTDNGWGSKTTSAINNDNGWGSETTSTINTDNGWGSKTASAVNTDDGWGSETTNTINTDNGWGSGSIGVTTGDNGWGSGINDNGWGNGTTGNIGDRDHKNQNAKPQSQSQHPLAKPPSPSPIPIDSVSAPLIPLLDRSMSLADNDQNQRDSLNIRTPVIEPASNIPTHPHKTLTRTEIYISTIRYIYKAVKIQLDIEDAQINAERWKRTQASKPYMHPTPATKEILENFRLTYAKKIADLTREFKTTIRSLVELPDLSLNTLHPDIDKNQLMDYAVQLKKWMAELRTYHHIYPTATSLSESIPPETPASPPSTWDKLWTDITELEHRADIIAEQIYFKRYISVDDSVLTTVMGKYQEKRKDISQQADEKLASLLKNANGVGNALEAQALLVADLLAEVHDNDQRHERLKAEKKELDDIKAQIESHFKRFEEDRRADAEQLHQLAGQVKEVHSLRRSLPPSVNINELLPEIRQIVKKNLEEEVDPVIKNFPSLCAQNNDRFVKELYMRLQPALDLTNNMCRSAQEEMGLQII